jgi:hypothetical protein
MRLNTNRIELITIISGIICTCNVDQIKDADDASMLATVIVDGLEDIAKTQARNPV